MRPAPGTPSLPFWGSRHQTALSSPLAMLPFNAAPASGADCRAGLCRTVPCVRVTEIWVAAAPMPAWCTGGASGPGSEAWGLGPCLVSAVSCCRLRSGAGQGLCSLGGPVPCPGGFEV